VLLAVLGIASIADGCHLHGLRALGRRDVPGTGLFCARTPAQLIQLHTISGLIGVVAATGAMYLIGTAAEPTSRVFGLISIGCGLGVAVIGLLDIPLLLTNSVIGLGERGRILLISIWLAALGMQLLVHSILPLRLRRHRWWRRAGATSLVSSGWRLGNE